MTIAPSMDRVAQGEARYMQAYWTRRTRNDRSHINSASFPDADAIQNNQFSFHSVAGFEEYVSLPELAMDDAELNHYLLGAAAGAAHEQTDCQTSPAMHHSVSSTFWAKAQGEICH